MAPHLHVKRPFLVFLKNLFGLENYIIAHLSTDFLNAV